MLGEGGFTQDLAPTAAGIWSPIYEKRYKKKTVVEVCLGGIGHRD